MKKHLISLSSALLALTAIFATTTLNAQAPRLQLVEPPLNPEWVRWMEEQEVKRALKPTIPSPWQQWPQLDPNTYATGYIPPKYELPIITGPATQIEKMVLAGLATYPSRYDMREEGFLTPIRDQGQYPICWAFPPIASIESSLKKTTGVSVSLSPWYHAWFTFNPMYVNEINWTIPHSLEGTVGGGGSHMVYSEATRGTGPVLEASVPYPSGGFPPADGTASTVATIKSVFGISTSGSSWATNDLYDWQNPYGSVRIPMIKGLVLTYGAVEVSARTPDHPYFDSGTSSFRGLESHTYPANRGSLHDVNIVGWDDNYPRSNFPVGNQPSTNGAWIMRNSWGQNWGDGGYFYMSYDSYTLHFSGVEASFDLDSKIYQYDLWGGSEVSSLLRERASGGYDRVDRAYFSNIFTASGNDKITEISFHTGEQDIRYEITILKGVTGGPGTGTQAAPRQTGTLELPGYHRIKLSTPVDVSNGEKFAIIVCVQSPDAYRKLIPIYRVSNFQVKMPPDISFISFDGYRWEPVKNIVGLPANWDAIICLKAFAVSNDTPSTSISVSVTPSTIKLPLGSTTTQFLANVADHNGITGVTWSADDGSFSPVGVYTAPNIPGTYTITATSVADTSKYGTATVTVWQPDPISVSISPSPAKTLHGVPITFSAEVTGGTGNQNVTWTTNGGHITPEGIYTPNNIGTYTVTATSVQDPSKSDTATVVVIQPGMGFSIDGIVGLMEGGIWTTFTGQTLKFTANTSGLSNTNCIWAASAGTFQPQQGNSSIYTAPSTPQDVTITATSVEEPLLVGILNFKIINANFDGNTSKSPQLMSFAFAYGSTRQADLDKYDFNGDGRIDEADLLMLIRAMGW